MIQTWAAIVAFPKNKSQCVHVETHNGERCFEPADYSGSHGFLCSKHRDQLPRGRRAYRDPDKAMVEGIVSTEQKALSTCKREVVKFGRAGTIQFVAGLKMTSDPKAYASKFDDYNFDGPSYMGKE